MTEREPPNERREGDDDWRESIERLEQEFRPRPRAPEPDQAPQRRSSAQGQPTPQRMMRQRIVPQGQQVRSRSQITAVKVLLAINVAMFALAQLLSSRFGGFAEAMLQLGALWRPAIDAGQWWRLLTPIVLHWNIAHLLFNSLALYWLGSDVERGYGTLRFLVIYLIGGFGGSVATYIFSPGALSAGASGAIFGLFGALGLSIWVARSLLGREVVRTQLIQVGTLLAFNLFYGFTVPNIGNAAHIGGLISGGLVALALVPRPRIVQRGGITGVARAPSSTLGWLGAAAVLVGLIGLFVAARLGLIVV